MVDYRLATAEITRDVPVPRRVLAIGAHPDDAEFGAGGTLAKWAASGAQVTILVLTDGSKGSWDQSQDPGDLARVRLREQAEAAEQLGATDTLNLGYVDGELEYDMSLRARVCLWIRRLRPEVVLGHDPWRRYMMHPDHRAAGWATIDGVNAARDHLFFPEQLDEDVRHHRPDALLLWAADRPDHYENIDGFVEPKVAALLAHSSQGTTTMGRAGSSAEATQAFRAEIYDRAKAVGAHIGFPAAELFARMTP